MDTITKVADDKSEALAARYGANALPPAGPWNETIAVLLGHRSVRSFLPTPGPEGTLETMIAAAQSASTSSTCRLVRGGGDDPAKRRGWRASPPTRGTSSSARSTWSSSPISRAGAYRHAAHRAQRPAMDRTPGGGRRGAGGAERRDRRGSLGLSMYIGAMRNDPPAVARLLDLPPGAFGIWTVPRLCRSGRRAESSRACRNRRSFTRTYKQEGESDLIARYDETLGAFSRRQNMPTDSWTARIKQRIAAITGREKMRDWLNALGFPLR